jgi:predicted secreted Zn-dependent protease
LCLGRLVHRCIEKAGGLDEYVLFSKPGKIADSQFAQDLRHKLIPAWEAKHGTTFDRRRLVFERKLADAQYKHEQKIAFEKMHNQQKQQQLSQLPQQTDNDEPVADQGNGNADGGALHQAQQ